MEKKYWFPATPPECGSGWGLPPARQGWMPSAGDAALPTGGAVLFAVSTPGRARRREVGR